MPEQAPPDVGLIVNGLSYRGWKSLSIRRSMEEFCPSFEVNFRDKWAERAEPVPINKGDAFAVTVDGDVLITGWIDDVNADYDATTHTLSAAGRSLTGDLVDCTAVVKERKARGWPKGTTPRTIATALCAPFSINVGGPDVAAQLDEKLVRPFAIERGEIVLDALSRIADLKGLILQTTREGNVLFCRAAGAKKVATVLRSGDNIKRARYTSSDRDRFSHYTFFGQTSADDNWNGEASTLISGFAEDREIKRYRPHEVTSHTQSDKKDLGYRAKLERNTRAGRAETITYTVRGWRHKDGLWSPKTLVQVDDAILNVRGEMMASGVVLTVTGGGSAGYEAEIEVCDKHAYDVVETPKPKRKAKKRSNFGGDRRADIPRRNVNIL